MQTLAGPALAASATASSYALGLVDSENLILLMAAF